LLFRALEKNSSIVDYWRDAAFLDQGNNLNFGEDESCINTDLLWTQAFRHHGFKILEKIDQLIMIMVTRITTTNSNDSILNEYFHRVAVAHAEYKIRQDHVDVNRIKYFY
jgi:hypothetical protein